MTTVNHTKNSDQHQPFPFNQKRVEAQLTKHMNTTKPENIQECSSTTASAVAALFNIIIRVEEFPPFADPDNPQDWDSNGDGFPDDESVSEPLYEHSRSTDPDAPYERRIMFEPEFVSTPPPRIVTAQIPSDFTAGLDWHARKEAAREKLPIPLVWELLGLEGSPSSSCNSPFRRDLKPSFSITPDGHRWKDWGTDEGGDIFDFIATAMSLPIGDAMLVGIHIAESGVLPPGVTPGSYVSKRQDEILREKEAQRSEWPPMRRPSDEELATICELRGLSVEGLKLAAEDKVLVTTSLSRKEAWCVRSRCGRNCQARLLTGKPWGIMFGKARTLLGSLGSTPIGLPSDKPIIALCEGGPDMLAAYCCIHDLGLRDLVGVVGMMGTSANFMGESLEQMRGKRVRIFVHRDQGGREAAFKWANQLRSVGANVDGFDFDDVVREDKALVKDLNDLIRFPKGRTEEQHMHKAFNFNN
jgi:hypothetical protein